MTPSAVERVTRAYKRKYNINDEQTAVVRAVISRIIQEMATAGPAMEPGKTA